MEARADFQDWKLLKYADWRSKNEMEKYQCPSQCAHEACLSVKILKPKMISQISEYPIWPHVFRKMGKKKKYIYNIRIFQYFGGKGEYAFWEIDSMSAQPNG